MKKILGIIFVVGILGVAWYFDNKSAPKTQNTEQLQSSDEKELKNLKVE